MISNAAVVFIFILFIQQAFAIVGEHNLQKYGDEYCQVFPDVGNNAFPGVKDDEDPKFSRSLDTVNFCRSAARADIAAKKLKDLKLWNYNETISFADIELQIYNRRKIKNKKSVESYISDYGFSDEEFNEFAHNVGFCPESKFPSELKNNRGLGNYLDHINAFQKKTTEASVGVPGLCPECDDLAPLLNKNDWEAVKSVIDKTKSSDDPAYNALLEINRRSCKDKDRIKLPTNYESFEMGVSLDRNKKDIKLLQNLLVEREVVGVNIRSDVLQRSNDNSKPGMHAAIIVGATLVNNKCYYVIKNSWAMDCARDPNFDSADRICDKKSGAVLLSTAAIEYNVASLTYIGTK